MDATGRARGAPRRRRDGARRPTNRHRAARRRRRVGLARTDEIGVPRQLVVGLTGVDFESIYGDNAVELDRALTDLIDGHGGVVLAGDATLGERLTSIDAQLSAQRELSSLGRAAVADVDGVFDALDLVLGAALTADRTDHSSIALERQQSQLDSLSTVVLSAGELNRVLIAELVQTAPNRVAIARAEATHEAHLQTFRATLDAAERVELDRVEATRRSAADELQLTHLAYLDALADYSDDFFGDTAATVHTRAEAARAEASRTTILFWMIAGLTLVLIGLVLLSILTPLRRLTRRADTVSNGNLDNDPLPLQGPRDIQRLTATMNDMAAALGRVNDRSPVSQPERSTMSRTTMYQGRSACHSATLCDISPRSPRSFTEAKRSRRQSSTRPTTRSGRSTTTARSSPRTTPAAA